MFFDKHGPLDLILYEDAHEEIRKWARNRIREMKVERLSERLEKWKPYIQQPQKTQLLTPKELQFLAIKLTKYINQIPNSKKIKAKLDSIETISSKDAYRSIQQLIEDLGESIVRCDTRQTFLSTSLFLFWAVDELLSLNDNNNLELMSMGEPLLSNYIATAILIEKQINSELLHDTINISNSQPYQASNHAVFFKKDNPKHGASEESQEKNQIFKG